MPILLYAFGLSFLVLAGGFAAVFSRWFSVVFPTMIIEAISFIAFALWITRRQRRTFQAQLKEGILQPVQAALALQLLNHALDMQIFAAPA